MSPRLWDLSEGASKKLVDNEGLAVGMAEQAQERMVVRGLAVVEEGACARVPMDA